MQSKIKYVILCTPFCAVCLRAKYMLEGVVIALTLGEEEQEKNEEGVE
jgi:hypothetical protein